MALTPGTRIGVYEITAQIGAGGMGQVYRARDTTLGRDVALKVLPEAFAHDAERLARFQREAKTLAALNHPHIAIIHGFEQTPSTPSTSSGPAGSGQAGVHAIVMELVEGDDLSQRIARRRAKGDSARQVGMPLDEALPIARQIAEALEAAHEQGIIHRDLKPANIKVRADGTVKVLDFGLAKAMDPPASSDASHSPTITSPAHLRQGYGAPGTEPGMILGTAAYMSPEQARGMPTDKRSDIWSFGVVLWEMLTGTRLFGGATVSDTLASVLTTEPPWSTLAPTTPAPVLRLLRRCLQKDRTRRLADLADARLDLDDALAEQPEERSVPVVDPRGRPLFRPSLWRRATQGTALVTMGAMLSGAGVWSLTRHEPPAVVRTTVTTSDPSALVQQGSDRDVAITPDGSRIVYRGSNQLLVRALNQLEPEVLSGLGAPRNVFISPDGQRVGFFDGAALKHVAITGGSPVLVTTIDGPPRGATWSPHGTLVFATDSPATGLQQVAVAGGEVTVLTRADPGRGEGDHRWPEFLPGGEALLFTITPRESGDLDNAQIAVLDLASRTYTVLVRGGSHAQYVSSGHLVYGDGGKLWAVAFDLRRLAVVGTPAQVLDGVTTTFLGAANVAVAGNGSLVYVPGGAGAGARLTAMWVDRQGRSSPLPGLPVDSYRDVRVSPDGARVAFATETDVWTYEIARATLSRLTTDSASDRSPLWTPDGQRIVFTSNRSGYPELFWRPADASGMDRPLLTRAKDLRDLRGTGWSKDGTQLLFTEVTQSPGAVGQFAVERPSDVKMLLKNNFSHAHAVVSPNGAWMAYQSNLSGRNEIYVERYPDLGGRQQVSSSGGMLPLWSPTGGEMFFTDSRTGELMAVAVQLSPLVIGTPQGLVGLEFSSLMPNNHPYDIAPDGRFVILRPAQEGSSRGRSTHMIVVQNWFEELKQRVPVP